MPNHLTLQMLQQIVEQMPNQDGYCNSERWQKMLDESAPGWITFVENINSGDLLQVKPKSGRDSLLVLLVETVGLSLANEWISLSDSDASHAAKKWFTENMKQFPNFCIDGKKAIATRQSTEWLIENITSDLWTFLSDAERKNILEYPWHVAAAEWHMRMCTAFSLYIQGATTPEIKAIIDDRHFSHHYHHRWYMDHYDYRYLRHHRRNANNSPMKALSKPFKLPDREPSPEADSNIANLLLVLKKVADEPSLQEWQKLRSTYEMEMYSLPATLSPPTNKNLIIPKQIKLWFQSKQELLAPGVKLPHWPKVIVSEDDPPLFKIHPYYKKMYEEDRELGFENSHADIEKLLGCYSWKDQHILLWRKGIDLCAKSLSRQNTDESEKMIKSLTHCVLVHEMGHWFNAEAKTLGNIIWDTSSLTLTTNGEEERFESPDSTVLFDQPSAILQGDARSLSSRSYHEAWAQFFVWLYGQEKDADVLKAFRTLELRQSKPYQAWRMLVNSSDDSYQLNHIRWSQDRILKSLEWSRGLRDANGKALPATFDDVNSPSTNMLGWL
jgi:hypothetical protein